MRIQQEVWRSLSHSQRRTLINKERRRRKRKDAALRREEEQVQLESQPGYWENVAEEEREREEQLRKEAAKSRLEEEAWLRREKLAQEAFRKQREKEEKAQREKEERENLIREEWEALQKREKEAEEKRERIRREKECQVALQIYRSMRERRQHLTIGQERLKEALSTEDRPATEKPTHNPLAPDDAPSTSSKNYGTEKDSLYCPFFLKTGACRFGDFCSRRHLHPTSSTTLLVPGMYGSLGLREWTVDDRDHDTSLEYEEGEMYEHFRAFYDDVFPEFAKAGRVIQFKVSCNFEPHLRGNVYVQYTTEEECSRAFQIFNGRWYAQRQLSCQYCPVQKWRNAICGLYNQNRCPKGKHCNFLHVFRNPGGAFSRADRDLPPLSPPSSRRGSFSSSRREWRYRSRSRSRSRERASRRESRDRSRERASRRESRDRSRERASRRELRDRSRDRHRGRRGRRGRSRERSSERHYRRRDRHSSESRHHSRREGREGGEEDGGKEGEKRGKRHRSSKRKKSLEHQETDPERGTDRPQSEALRNGEEGGVSSLDKSDRKKKRKKSDDSPPSKHQRHKHKRHKKHKKHSHRQAGSPGSDHQEEQEEEGEEEKEGEEVEGEVCHEDPDSKLPLQQPTPSSHPTPSNTLLPLVAMDTCTSPKPETLSPSSDPHGRLPHTLSSQTPTGDSVDSTLSPKPEDLAQSPEGVSSGSPPPPSHPTEPSPSPPSPHPTRNSPQPELMTTPLPPHPAPITSSPPPPLVPKVTPNYSSLEGSPSSPPVVGNTSSNEHPQPKSHTSTNTAILLSEGGSELVGQPQ